MKQFYHFLAFFFIAFSSCNSSLAQYIPVPSTIKTPYGNVPYTTYVYNRMNYYHGMGNISAKYEFKAILKNGEQKVFKSRINLEDTIHSLTYKEDGIKKKLTPKETVEIFRYSFSGKKIAGIPTDSCWLFKVLEGKINGYSFLSEESTTYLSAFQEEDGEILPLTKDNVMFYVGDDPRRIKWIEKGNYVKAILDYNKE